ncbi:MAG: PQQ-binding-like beta-propeller repeat protein, partial [Pirellulaceae bacterium]
MNRIIANVLPARFGLAFLSTPTTTIHAQDDPADHWPNFRGPTFNGTSETADPPTEWSEEKNVKWKVELPGPGNNASPVVWGDKVFVLTAIPDPNATPEPQAAPAPPRQQRGRRGRRGRRPAAPLVPTKFVTLCYDRNTGEKLWEQLAVEATPHQGHHQDHSFASASPITDGQHVYSHFGSRGLYCYDMDGNLKWSRDDFGQMMTRNGFGEGSSPVLYKDTIVVPWDHEGDSWVMALDALTGETKWKAERDEPSNWVTPVVVEHDGQPIVVTGGENFARAYDLKSGEELWRSGGFTSRPITAPVVYNDVVFLASSRQGAFLAAFYFGDKGSITPEWSTDQMAPDVPSLMLSDKRLLFLSGSRNILHCVDAATFEPLYGPVRLEDISGVYASPVAAGGYVIIVGRDGVAMVLKDSDEFEVVSTNR